MFTAKIKPGLWLAILLCVLTVLASACGSKPAEQPKTEGQAAGGNGSAAASSDEVLKKIAKTKTLTVGTDATFKPFEYKSNDKYEGFDIELIQAVAKELGADKVEFVDTEFKGLIPGMQAGKFDLIVSAMYITEERMKTIDFSDTYFPGGLSIMTKKDNKSINGINDLKGKKVSVQIGTKSVKFLEEGYKDIQMVKVEKNTEMFLELETGKVDAVITGSPAAKTYAKEKGTVQVLPQELTEEFYGYGIRKENPEFKKAVNEALKRVKANGTYDQIVKKWFE
ncbi:transporter substrate-binding domain-containing protein [Paenibacillus mesophilus]|uniref:transporter substrate-binding domain-containing protein n=1 Tax=Paenibacillus mesophilus TaxID=2582849 RepID=UPI00110DD6F8|nr:transporter substrate-binding domain-containing protein [Paenibacillus mesophilus]TMV52253.1 transporter substrate-binding domain-containing protein [Paenibacillus mesophilus]